LNTEEDGVNASGTRIVILGAGPAGVGAAYRLRRERKAQVIVVEQKPVVGGNAGSFSIGAQRVDYGSHRLHPSCDPGILVDIRKLLGEDLIERPRHGRIRLRGRWIHFPLRPLDLVARLDRGFAGGAMLDALARVLPLRRSDGETFESVLRARLGPTVCEHFYFPYARKIWGIDPAELSATQAYRRVAANSFPKLARKLAGRLPGVRSVGFSHFYYPRGGFGQICESYAQAARERGAQMLLGWRAERLIPPASAEGPWRVIASRAGQMRELEADHVWSTIPLGILARIVDPPPEAPVLEAATRLRFRAMLLVYVTLDEPRFSEYDAHYFPEPAVSITRLSEPANYSLQPGTDGRTTLCAELPCDTEDDLWALEDAALGARVLQDMETAGIPVRAPVAGIEVRRLRQAYPIYGRDYARWFGRLDAWASGLSRLLTYGRQGLFAHDNTHHALAMAYGAVGCLHDGVFDEAAWRACRRVFETHVVED